MRTYICLYKRTLVELVDDSRSEFDSLVPVICTGPYDLIEKLKDAKVTGIITDRSFVPVTPIHILYHAATETEIELCQLLQQHNKLGKN